MHSNMALLKYFAKSESLPDPNGPLSSTLKPETIESVNRNTTIGMGKNIFECRLTFEYGHRQTQLCYETEVHTYIRYVTI